MSSVDYSSLDSIASTAGYDDGSSDSSSDDSVIAQITDAMGTAGTTAVSLLAQAQGPTALAPGTSYVLSGGKVVTTPTQNSVTSLFGSSQTLLLIALAVLVFVLVMHRKRGG